MMNRRQFLATAASAAATQPAVLPVLPMGNTQSWRHVDELVTEILKDLDKQTAPVSPVFATLTVPQKIISRLTAIHRTTGGISCNYLIAS